MKKKKIVVAGHLCVDITPEFAQSSTRSLDEIMRPGKLTQVGKANFSAGGVVTNTGLALKVLGCDVLPMGKIADDTYGDVIRKTFELYDAAEHLILCPGESSSYTIAIAPPGVDRIFLHHPGTNDSFCCDDLDFDAIARADHLHFGYPPLMKSTYLNGGAETVTLLKRAKALGLTTSLDMAAVDEGSEAGRQDWAAIIRNVLPWTDFFLPSVEELCFMMDKERYNSWNERANGGDITASLDPETDIRPLADTLIEWGAHCVLIKCGVLGMYLRTAAPSVMSQIGPEFESWGDIAHFERSYKPDLILSGTGAGDTSIAAFLKAMTEGYGPIRCVQLAAATGAVSLASYDALGGLKSFDELNKRIDEGWQKNS